MTFCVHSREYVECPDCSPGTAWLAAASEVDELRRTIVDRDDEIERLRSMGWKAFDALKQYRPDVAAELRHVLHELTCRVPGCVDRRALEDGQDRCPDHTEAS